MTSTPDYLFYLEEYDGHLTEEQFNRCIRKAVHRMEHYSRVYQVEGDDTAVRLAVCAIADILAEYDEAEQNGNPSSMSVGSVSVSLQQKDLSETALNRDCLSAVRRYVDICRGVF